jgi:hypothetical protein
LDENNPVPDATNDNKAESEADPNWFAFGAIALIAAGLAGIVAMPDFWQENVIEGSGRRGRILNLILAPIGFTNTIAILLSISAISAVVAGVDLVKVIRNKRSQV